jgi:hypothetical protein
MEMMIALLAVVTSSALDFEGEVCIDSEAEGSVMVAGVFHRCLFQTLASQPLRSKYGSQCGD